VFRTRKEKKKAQRRKTNQLRLAPPPRERSDCPESRDQSGLEPNGLLEGTDLEKERRQVKRRPEKTGIGRKKTVPPTLRANRGNMNESETKQKRSGRIRE